MLVPLLTHVLPSKLLIVILPFGCHLRFPDPQAFLSPTQVFILALFLILRKSVFTFALLQAYWAVFGVLPHVLEICFDE